MIQERQSTHHIEGSLSGERVAMQIDEAAHQHIMAVLTDLYADPIAAVVREYATNAWDAHREAGINRPIDVTLPVRFSPFLSVRDYGVGLDAEGIRDVYSKYGASTKRTTNDQVGMLGLGCKSALTYCDQFTVVGVKGGRRVQVAIGRDENGVGVMTIVSDEPTTDPPGVDVVVPVKLEDVGEFGEAASAFFAHWLPGDVLVNGEAPAARTGLDLGNDLLLEEADAYDREKHLLVMGNVAYPCPLPWEGAPRRVRLVARVPIGSISIPPNRESVMDTPLTRHTWAKVIKLATAGITKAVQSNIDAAATRGEALDVRDQWASKLRVDRAALTYKGEAMPVAVEFADRQKPGWEAKVAYAHDRTGAQKHASKEWEVQLGWMRRNIVVEGWDRPTFTETQGKKLRLWLERSGLRNGADAYDLRGFLLVRDPAQLNGERKWLNPARIVDWAVINDIKLERSAVSNRSGRPTGSYDIIETTAPNGGDWAWHHMTAEQIEAAAPAHLYHVQGNRYMAKRNMEGLEKGAYLVCLPANRVAKYERYFTESLELNATMEARAKAWLKALKPGDKRALALHASRDHNTLTQLDASRVDDPALKRDIVTAKRDINSLKAARRRWERHLGHIDIPVHAPIQKGYHLIAGSYLNKKDDHVYTYINAVYAANTTQEAS